jgi:UDP-glucose 4-epimerase
LVAQTQNRNKLSKSTQTINQQTNQSCFFLLRHTMSSPSTTTSSPSKRSKNDGQQQKQTVLVTGGAGFIGSHTILDLLQHKYRVVVIDNLDNSSTVSLSRLREISNCAQDDIVFVEVDLVDLEKTKSVVHQYGPFIGCIHFAGFKAVGESVSLPLHYYYNNLVGTMNLLTALQAVGCFGLVFSSSETVYGTSQNMPLVETEPLGATNPYGQTKFQIEQILKDVGAAPNSKWRIALLRYFNPVGAHPSGKIGEDPQGMPNNLLPFVAQVAVGKREKVNVFGNDYPTPDGTGVRDYIHVCDLASAHVAALNKVNGGLKPGTVEAYNVGTGKGSSVLDVIHAFEKAAGKKIPYVIAPRRAGDVASSYCDPTKAQRELGFQATRTLDDACVDAWRWQVQNPNGFKGNELSSAGNGGGGEKRKALVFALLS